MSTVHYASGLHKTTTPPRLAPDALEERSPDCRRANTPESRYEMRAEEWKADAALACDLSETKSCIFPGSDVSPGSE